MSLEHVLVMHARSSSPAQAVRMPCAHQAGEASERRSQLEAIALLLKAPHPAHTTHTIRVHPHSNMEPGRFTKPCFDRSPSTDLGCGCAAARGGAPHCGAARLGADGGGAAPRCCRAWRHARIYTAFKLHAHYTHRKSRDTHIAHCACTCTCTGVFSRGCSSAAAT